MRLLLHVSSDVAYHDDGEEDKAGGGSLPCRAGHENGSVNGDGKNGQGDTLVSSHGDIVSLDSIRGDDQEDGADNQEVEDNRPPGKRREVVTRDTSLGFRGD